MLLVKTQPISNRAELALALQKAVMLEHATIPPYLTALYTLKGETESVRYARATIRDVIIEEMLHMSLVANILSAMGEAPKITDVNFIPTYPGPLPMGIGDDDGAAPGMALEVGLKRYSRDTVGTVFMAIEEPENRFDIPDVTARAAALPTFQTIGQFYASVKRQIRAEGDTLFENADIGRQVVGWFDAAEEVVVTDVAGAERAIDIIVTQGEGTPKRPIDLQGDVPHFYRFQELFLGKKLVADTNSELGLAFDPNQPIAIDDSADVIQMVDNPPLVQFASPQIGRLADECDGVYTKLLKVLQTAFAGEPDKMQAAFGLMFELRTLAEELLRQPLDTGEFAGPRFRFVSD
jgi:hypothetical protein